MLAKGSTSVKELHNLTFLNHYTINSQGDTYLVTGWPINVVMSFLSFCLKNGMVLIDMQHGAPS